MAHYRITQIEDYEPLIGSENVERVREKARRLKDLRVAISIPPITEAQRFLKSDRCTGLQRVHQRVKDLDSRLPKRCGKGHL